MLMRQQAVCIEVPLVVVMQVEDDSWMRGEIVVCGEGLRYSNPIFPGVEKGDRLDFHPFTDYR